MQAPAALLLEKDRLAPIDRLGGTAELICKL